MRAALALVGLTVAVVASVFPLATGRCQSINHSLLMCQALRYSPASPAPPALEEMRPFPPPAHQATLALCVHHVHKAGQATQACV